MRINGNRDKKEIMMGIHLDKSFHRQKEAQAFSMASFYLKQVSQSILCGEEEHEWDRSGNLCGNIVEADLMGNDIFYFRFRKCVYCGEEMPESRDYFRKGIKEKNG